MTTWFVYILRCSDDTLYTGITTNLERRTHEHNHHNRLGAKYTRSRRPVNVVYHQVFKNRSMASKEEYRIKKMNKKSKELLIPNNNESS
ncbi:MAG: GIY-YIG nuclease family protein [Methylococcales bacterium]|jgi:putative endonuclease|nr:GIY-YIG nuclease family protein [Methylococcales bacterium]MBT7409492.1 GIY-YIG nuclease family protein [Methylococcales bacterium]